MFAPRGVIVRCGLGLGGLWFGGGVGGGRGDAFDFNFYDAVAVHFEDGEAEVLEFDGFAGDGDVA